MAEFSHLTAENAVNMVDISQKGVSERVAKAYGRILLSSDSVNRINNDAIGKGNVLTTAKLAGIMAAKNTYNTIPLCHQIRLSSIEVDFITNSESIEVYSYIKCSDKTGAEMEALNTVSVALLTVYDMCKAVDKGMVIEEIKLCEKSKRSV